MTTSQALMATALIFGFFVSGCSILYGVIHGVKRRIARWRANEKRSRLKDDVLDQSKVTLALLASVGAEAPFIEMTPSSRRAAAFEAHRALRDDTHWGAMSMQLLLVAATDGKLTKPRGCMSERPDRSGHNPYNVKLMDVDFGTHSVTGPVSCHRPSGHSGLHTCLIFRDISKTVMALTWSDTEQDISQLEYPIVDPAHLRNEDLEVEKLLRARMREVLELLSKQDPS